MPAPHTQLAAAFAAGAALAAAVTAAMCRHCGWRGRTRGWQQRAAEQVAPPHPAWTAPAPQNPPHNPDDLITVDVSSTPSDELYPLIISAVVPRPIGFVATISSSGATNLAPYSFFNVLTFSPPIVVLGCCHSPARGNGKKDTLMNIEETREFTVNIISEWFVEAANHCAGTFPPGVDEFKESGLTPLASDVVLPPRVRESAVQLECRLRQVIDINGSNGQPTAGIVLGEVVRLHIARGVAGRSPSGKLVVDAAALAPVCRLGGIMYGRVTELYNMPRPDGQGRYPVRGAG